MIRKRQNAVYATLLLALACAPLSAASFVYEGQLDDRGAPANGRYDIQLAVYRDAELGASVTAPIVFSAVEVSDGRFRLDFDAKLEGGESAWVELAVRDAGGGEFSAIPGRTKATQAPAAIGACWSSVGDSGSNPSTNFIGTTDNQPLVLRVNGLQALRLVPGATSPNLIAGASGNTVSLGVQGATIGGGGESIFSHRVTDNYGTVNGGSNSRAGDDAGTPEDRPFATVGGGWANIASGESSTISGGASNTANSLAGTIGGGSSNVVSGIQGTVSGGRDSTASGSSSTVAGGVQNCAGGSWSFAAGRRAKVRPGSGSGIAAIGCSGIALSGDVDGDQGSFVWADSQDADFVSTGPNQFLVRAAGGMAINANDTGSSTFRVNGTIRVDTLGTNSAGAPTLCRNAGNQIALCSSSKRYKNDITDLPPSLDAVLALRPVSYRWKANGAPDIGFVAEEIAELDERLITRNDSGEIEGVKYERLSALLASAVQEMAAREQLQAREIDELRKDLAELRTLIETQRTGDR